MSRNLLFLAVGVIAVLVIVGIFIVPATNNNKNGSFDWSFSVIGEDSQGNPITLPFSWWIAGVEVTKIRPTITWSCSGVSIDWTTLVIHGEFFIFRLNYQGTEETDISPSRLDFTKTGSDAKNGDNYFSTALDSLIAGVPKTASTTNGDSYWDLKIKIQIDGFVEQTSSYGNTLTDSFVDSVSYRVTWIDGAFTIGGNLT